MQRKYFSSIIIVTALFAGILLSWAAILLPSHAATLATITVDQQRETNLTVSNSAAKGDRLTLSPGKIGQSKSDAASPKAKATMPSGCETAFSKLVRTNNLAVRCITAIEAPNKAG